MLTLFVKYMLILPLQTKIPSCRNISITFPYMLHISILNLSPAILISLIADISATDTDVCYASGCLCSVAVYLASSRNGISLSRCPPIIFAHLEFLDYLSDFLLIGFVTEDRWGDGFSRISWCKEFTGIFSPTTPPPPPSWFRLTFGFNLFRSTIKRF